MPLEITHQSFEHAMNVQLTNASNFQMHSKDDDGEYDYDDRYWWI